MGHVGDEILAQRFELHLVGDVAHEDELLVAAVGNDLVRKRESVAGERRDHERFVLTAEEWAARNKWFGQDRVLTYGAWGIHQTLVENEGFDPTSDEYYTELDRRLREEFPKRFPDESPQQTNRQQRSAPAVAPATRSSGINSARRTVRLSPSQVAIAKKLNVPLEEYAKYVKE